MKKQNKQNTSKSKQNKNKSKIGINGVMHYLLKNPKLIKNSPESIYDWVLTETDGVLIDITFDLENTYLPVENIYLPNLMKLFKDCLNYSEQLVANSLLTWDDEAKKATFFIIGMDTEQRLSKTFINNLFQTFSNRVHIYGCSKSESIFKKLDYLVLRNPTRFKKLENGARPTKKKKILPFVDRKVFEKNLGNSKKLSLGDVIRTYYASVKDNT